MAPHPQLQRAYFSTLRSRERKHRVPQPFHLFAHLHLLSSDSFSSLTFSLLPVSYPLTLPTSVFRSVHAVGSLTSRLPLSIANSNNDDKKNVNDNVNDSDNDKDNDNAKNDNNQK